MGHLSSVDFVDLLEGAGTHGSKQHLSECDRCRGEFAALRETVFATASADIPEPSPLFWEHLSARVREWVRGAEQPRHPFSLGRLLLNTTRRRVAVALGSCAVVVVMTALVGSRLMAPAELTSSFAPPPPPGPPGTARDFQDGASAILGAPDDLSLSLVAAYGRTLEWDDLREQMAVSTHPGSLDGGVGALDSGERRELERLLKEELAPKGSRTDRS